MQGTHHRAAHRVEGPERAAPQAVAHLRAHRGAERLAGEYQRTESKEGDERPRRLLDLLQRLAQDAGQQQGQPESGNGAGESEHRAEEPGPRAGEDPEGQQEEDDDVQEIHRHAEG